MYRSYDPCCRPWFVAASSGPKDVNLILDESRIIETLCFLDNVALVFFETNAKVLNGQEMLICTTKENLKLGQGTNFYQAFLEELSVLERTFSVELTTGCHVVVLFMTDGRISTRSGSNEAIQLVKNKRYKLLADFGRTVTIFPFSLGNHADKAVTKTIACSTGGIWISVQEK
ncbi:hypothetical protein ACHAXS_001359 [Conticribra weissflogii]